MRILIANHARGALGGVESILRRVTPALAARGHIVAALFERRMEAAGGGGDPYAVCAAEWSLEDISRGKALAAVRDWRPDAIWLHNVEDAELEADLAAAAPCVFSVHGYRGLCATGTRLQRRPAPHVCTRSLGPGCLSQNYLHGCGLRRPTVLARRYRAERRHQATMTRHGRRVLACSGYVAAELIRQGVAADRVVALPNPLPHPPLTVLPEAPEAPPSRLLCLARLTLEKGVHVLLEALPLAGAELKRSLTLTVAGDGPELERLRRQASAAELPVALPGWLGREAREAAFAQADLLIVPSLWPEPFGIVGLEAQGHGVPAAAFGVGGIPEWLTPGCNGEMAPAGTLDAAALAAAMVRALGSSEHWRQLRRQAWLDSHRFSLGAYVERVERILMEAAA